MKRQWPALLAVALLAAAGGYFAAMTLSPDPSPGDGSPDIVGQHRPDFSHADPGGRMVSATDFDGKVLLLNFWATWCEPCVEEMPMLSSLQDQYRGQGLEIVGIALDEPERAAAFAAGLDLSYPVLVGGAGLVVSARRYGNASGMLPYSVLVGRDGTVRWTRLGALEPGPLTHEIRRLLDAN